MKFALALLLIGLGYVAYEVVQVFRWKQKRKKWNIYN